MENSNIFVTIAMALVAAISSFVAIFKKGTPKGKVENLSQNLSAEIAKNEITAEIKRIICTTEGDFASLNKLLKGSTNESAGGIKKEFAIMHMKTFCLLKGYPYDEASILAEIEEMIEFSLSVNASK